MQRVQDVLRWLERGAAVSQVRELLEHATDALTPIQGEWGERIEQLIDAIARLAQRPLDQLLNQAMALYPAVTVCERLLLPLLDALDLRWRTHFDARLEQVFFHTWLRSKLGARVYHDHHSLAGPCVLLARTDDAPFDADFWLSAWLLSSSGQPLGSSNGPWSLASCSMPSTSCNPGHWCCTWGATQTCPDSHAPCIPSRYRNSWVAPRSGYMRQR